MSYMGMYDSVHTGSRCGQTKAFSRLLSDITPGDSVVFNNQDLSGDVDVAMPSGGWLHVHDGVLVGWFDYQRPESVAVDHYGVVLRTGDDPYRFQGRTREALMRAADRAVLRASRTGDELSFSEAMADALKVEDAVFFGAPGDCAVCAALRS